ncbi:branched-chain amino acid ABC transporter permease [Sabulicella rubraurantiaca]|uniref:branched-chain amino acid ABC transporter permease n=1 Tax=Sabulicella rubraurantiaca TaxID=2811429 RepID=UPI001A96BE7F|nr:branched-chain amino acid ABC transporter permease [Sabulicella rubraurantiaca]
MNLSDPRLVLAFIAAAGALGLVLPAHATTLLTEALILCLFALSLDLLVGHARLTSFGHAGPWGFGAYVAAGMLLAWQVPLPVAVLAAGALTALLAIPVGWLCVRTGGVAFAMLSLAFAQLGYAVVFKWNAVTGGSDGLPGVPRAGLGEFLAGREGYHLLVVAFLGAAYLLAWGFVRSPLGRVVAAVRENEQRAEALGHDPRRIRLVVFVLSYFLAGVAGALYAGFARYVSPELFFWTVSGHVLVMVVLGGAGTLVGPMLGALALFYMEHQLSALTESWGLALGLLFILVVIFAPRGLMGWLQAWRPRRRDA